MVASPPPLSASASAAACSPHPWFYCFSSELSINILEKKYWCLEILLEYQTLNRINSEKQMDHLAAAEEQIASQRLQQKLQEVNVAAQAHLAPIQDHVNFSLQKAYFKCAYECFDRSRKQEEITRCVENCSIPLSNAQQKFDNEMAQFQERLNRALVVCQDKYEAAKMQKKPGAMNDMVSCADQSIQDGIKMLPLLADKLKASLSVRDSSS